MAQFPSTSSAYGVWSLKENRDAEMGDNWPLGTAPIVATGGTITTVGDYKVHTFTSSGTFTVSDAGAGNNGGIEYLIIAGGAGGGAGAC